MAPIDYKPKNSSSYAEPYPLDVQTDMEPRISQKKVAESPGQDVFILRPEPFLTATPHMAVAPNFFLNPLPATKTAKENKEVEEEDQPSLVKDRFAQWESLPWDSFEKAELLLYFLSDPSQSRLPKGFGPKELVESLRKCRTSLERIWISPVFAWGAPMPNGESGTVEFAALMVKLDLALLPWEDGSRKWKDEFQRDMALLIQRVSSSTHSINQTPPHALTTLFLGIQAAKASGIQLDASNTIMSLQRFLEEEVEANLSLRLRHSETGRRIPSTFSKVLEEAIHTGESDAAYFLDPSFLQEIISVYENASHGDADETYVGEWELGMALRERSPLLARQHFRRALELVALDRSHSGKREALWYLAAVFPSVASPKENEELLHRLLSLEKEVDAASEDAELAEGLLALVQGRWQEAEEIFGGFPSSDNTAELLDQIAAARVLYRKLFTVAALQAVSFNFLGRGHSTWLGGYGEEEFQKLCQATEEGWIKIQSRYFSEGNSSLVDTIRAWRIETGASDFRTGFIYAGEELPGVVDEEFGIASAASSFLKVAEDEWATDEEFHDAVLEFADKLASQGYWSSAVSLYENLAVSGFHEETSRVRLEGGSEQARFVGLVHMTWNLAAFFAGPSGFAAVNSTSGANAAETFENLSVSLFPLGVGKWFAKGAESLFLHNMVSRLGLVRTSRVAGFVVGQLGFAFGYTAANALALKFFQGQKAITFQDLRREFGGALIAGVLLHGAQRAWLRGTQSSPWLKKIDSIPARWGRDVGVLFSAGLVQESLGLREPHAKSNLGLRIFETVVLDLQFRLADRTLNRLSGWNRGNLVGSEWMGHINHLWKSLRELPLRLAGSRFFHAGGNPKIGELSGMQDALNAFLLPLLALRNHNPGYFSRKGQAYLEGSLERRFLQSLETLTAELSGQGILSKGLRNGRAVEAFHTLVDVIHARITRGKWSLGGLTLRHPRSPLSARFLSGLEGIAASLAGSPESGVRSEFSMEVEVGRISRPATSSSQESRMIDLVVRDLRSRGENSWMGKEAMQGLSDARRAELGEIFYRGGGVSPHAGGFRLYSRTMGADTLRFSKSDAAEFFFFQEWASIEGFPRRPAMMEAMQAWTEIQSILSKNQIQIHAHFGAKKQDTYNPQLFVKDYASQVTYLSELLRNLPSGFLESSGLKRIHLNSGRKGPGKGAAYDPKSGTLYLFSGTFFGARRYLMETFLHELGHAVSARLNQQRSRIDDSLRVILERSQAYPKWMPRKDPNGIDNNSIDEFLADAVTAYAMDGHRLREHIQELIPNSIEHTAWSTVYTTVRHAFEGREFGLQSAWAMNRDGHPRRGMAYRDASEKKYGSYAVYTEEGIGYKPVNEDAYVQGDNWAIVLDGMGGATEGAKASEVAGKALAAAMEAHGDMKRAFVEAAGSLNQALAETGGAVAVGHQILQEADGRALARIVHAGDAAAIVFRKNSVGGYQAVFRTDDHNYPGMFRKEEVAKGLPRQSTLELRIHPYANQVTNGLIKGRTPVPEKNEVPLQKGDVVMMFSDGIGDNFTTQEIAAMIPGCKSPRDLLIRVVSVAKEKMTRLKLARELFDQFEKNSLEGKIFDLATAKGDTVPVTEVNGVLIDERGRVYNSEGMLVDSYKSDNLTFHVYFHL